MLSSARQHIPLGMWDNAWDKVKRENALNSLLLPIDGERDALVQERNIRCPAPLVKCAGIQCGQVIQQHLVMRTRNAGRCKHLVEEAANVILACDDCRSVT